MKRGLVVGIVLLLMALLVACTPMTPKKVLQDAFAKSESMESFAFDFDIGFQLKPAATVTDYSVLQAASILSDVSVGVNGKYSKADEYMEMVVSVALKGDMQVTLDIPVIVDGKKIYVKLPNTPFAPLPENLIGKYLVLDIDTLEDKGVGDQQVDIKVAQELVKEVLGVLIDDFGGTDFVSDLKGESRPANTVDAKHVVQFKVTDGSLEELITILQDRTIPKLLDIVEKPEFRVPLGIDSSKINEIRVNLETEKITPEDLAELRESFILEEASYIVGVDKKNYLSHQNLSFSGTVKEGGNTYFKLYAESALTDINEKQVFSTTAPSKNQVVTMEELLEFFYGGLGTQGAF